MTTDEYGGHIPPKIDPMVTEDTARRMIGDTLANGAKVLLCAGPGAGDYCVVLCSIHNGQEWVTWRVNPETGEAFWGDYFRDPIEAAASFIERSCSFRTSRYTVELSRA